MSNKIHLIVFFVLQFTLILQAEASWEHDFIRLKDRPRSFEDIGAICEELARLKFEDQYPQNQYTVEVGIEYSDSQKTIGELDIVVFDNSKNTVIHIAEVKCWKDMKAGLEKAIDQRNHFLTAIQSAKKLIFQSTFTEVKYSKSQFSNSIQFSRIGQKGAVEEGYDLELEYDLKELRRLGMEMLRCQDRGECAKP